ncbi:hypothetical protein QAD02_005320 [Eretmocerus hayati]|uniref:Uncharacterized protein n=1 Tax=Eretmocerus hayati TaxID=131215 RepID=A0ACC2NT83_9HYME|nr:hypothetical protein QAD02_005320 [Eretmocerus hayati]
MKITKPEKMYNVIKAEQSLKGFSFKELVDKISRIYEMKDTKGFRRKVETALRRGISYGILVKNKNRYRFDPEENLLNSLNRPRRRGKKLNISRRTGKHNAKISKCKMSSRPNRKQQQQSKNDSQQPHRTPPTVPRPTVPPPPNFSPRPRNLLTEPFTKVVKPRDKKN